MKLPITKSQVEHAATVINKLTPILSTMQQATLEMFSGNAADFEAHQRQIKLTQSHITAANIVFEQCKTHREEIGGEAFIGRIINRSFKVLEEIDGLERATAMAGGRYEEQTNEFKRKGFTQQQIDALIENPKQSVQANKEQIERLQVERQKIEQFLASSPAYEVELLSGTDFFPGLHKEMV